MTQQDNPNHSKIAEKLKQVAIEAFHGADRNNLTLKSVREKVEDILGLDKGILRNKGWKDESKAIVEHIVQQLLEAEEKEQEKKHSECDYSSDNDESLSQTRHRTTSVKKQISKKRSQQPMDDVICRGKCLKGKKLSTCREQRANDPCDRSSSEQEVESIKNSHDCNISNFKSEKLANSLPDLKVELSSADDINKAQQLGDLNNRKGNLQHDSSIQKEIECVTCDKVQEIGAGESRVKDEHNDIKSLPLDLSDENSKEKDAIESRIRPTSEPLQQRRAEETLTSQSIATNHESKTDKDKKIRQNEDEEAMDSDMSVVIDEEPPEKRRKKKGQKGETSGAGKIAPKSKKTSQRSSSQKNDKKLSSDEEMLKKLQSQLRKCGVKTIWHFELKEYGEDTRAKIRHLQKSLKDVGMQGRFSEARAKEIKESRELMADLEAVKEGDMKWGLKRNHNYDDRENEKLSVNEDSDLEVESDYVKGEFKGKSMRNKSLKRKSTYAVQQPRQRSNALDWLGDEESSEG